MKKDVLGRSMVLDGIRSAYEKSYAAGNDLDAKLQNLLNFCSVIIAIVASIETAAFQSKVGIFFWILLIIALILYFSTFVVVVDAIKPTKYYYPISNDWDELSRRYFHAEEKEILDVMISEHLTSIISTRKANNPKVKAVKIASFLMMAIVILLLIAVPIGLIFSTPTLSCFLHLASCTTSIP